MLNTVVKKLKVENTLPEPKYPKYTLWVCSQTVPPQDRYKTYTEFKSNSALAVRQYTDFSTVLFYNGSLNQLNIVDPYNHIASATHNCMQRHN